MGNDGLIILTLETILYIRRRQQSLTNEMDKRKEEDVVKNQGKFP